MTKWQTMIKALTDNGINQSEKGRVIDCTASERWATDDTWAVMKGTNKRAAKVCKSESEAEEWINGRDGFSIQLRKGV